MLSLTKSRLAGKLFTHTLFFFLLTSQICFGQWYAQNSGTTQHLNKVQFIDANTGWAVGDNGLILYTSNGGSTWIQQSSGIQLPITDIVFVDASTCWVLGRERDWWLQGEHNILLKTTNGGIDWVQQINDTTCYLDAICFINQNIGWITGKTTTLYDSVKVVLMKTIDAGNNWLPQSPPYTWGSSNSDYAGSQFDICFIDPDTGYIVSGYSGILSAGIIIKTTDGGDTWSEPWWSGNSWRKVDFSDSQNGIAIGRGVSDRTFWGCIYHTTNGGEQWQQLLDEQWYTSFNDAYIGTSDVISVVGSYFDFNLWQVFGRILRSEDSGTSWLIQDSISSPLNGVSFIDDYTGWAVGENGLILHTTNGGVSFVKDETTQPTEFTLEQNYPNPFNPITVISYQLPVGGNVTLTVYDILGNEIAKLIDEYKPSGKYEVTWYAQNLPSGVYFYQLRASEYVQTRKMILIK